MESGGVGEWGTGRGGSGGVGLESRPRQLSKEYFPHTQLEKSPLFHFIYTCIVGTYMCVCVNAQSVCSLLTQ